MQFGRLLTDRSSSSSWPGSQALPARTSRGCGSGSCGRAERGRPASLPAASWRARRLAPSASGPPALPGCLTVKVTGRQALLLRLHPPNYLGSGNPLEARQAGAPLHGGPALRGGGLTAQEERACGPGAREKPTRGLGPSARLVPGRHLLWCL